MRPVNPHTKYMRIYGGGGWSVKENFQYISVLYDMFIRVLKFPTSEFGLVSYSNLQ